MAGEVTFGPPQADHVAANRLWLRHSRQRRWLKRAGLVVLGLGSIDIISRLAFGADLGGAVSDASVFLICGTLLLLLPMITRPFIGRSVARTFAQRPAFTLPVSIAWTNDALTMTAPDSYAQLRWRELNRWVEDGQTFLALPTDHSMLIVPLRALTSEQAADLRETAARHGPAPG